MTIGAGGTAAAFDVAAAASVVAATIIGATAATASTASTTAVTFDFVWVLTFGAMMGERSMARVHCKKRGIDRMVM